MAKVLDVQQFVVDQTQLHKERRTSQHIFFLNKSPAFPTYYTINKNVSTSEFSAFTIDQYIGKNSPVRYDKIINMPLYGLPEITDESQFDELIGTNTEGYTGEATILPGIIEPTEGDCFILNYFNKKMLFIVNNVSEVTLKSQPHFKIQFHVDSQDKISLLEKQVYNRYTAIFENIGTEDRVILESESFNKMNELIDIYKKVSNYYVNKYFRRETTTFEALVVVPNDTSGSVPPNRFIDKYLQKFMVDNKIIILDKILKTNFVVDYNGLYEDGDFQQYETSLFYAVTDKSIDRFLPTDYIFVNILNNPFSLYGGYCIDTPYYSEQYLQNTPENQMYIESTAIPYSFTYLYNKIISNKADISEPVDNLCSIIVKYFNNTELTVKDFTGILNKGVSDLDNYIYLPIILYIMSINIQVTSLNVSNILTTQ